MKLHLRRALLSALACILPTSAVADSDLVQRLDQLGFFRFAADPAAARAEFHQGWTGIYADSGRLFPADSEALTEQGIGAFLREIAGFLHKLGVPTPTVTEHVDEERGYRITVNGKVYVIWTDDASVDWGVSQVITTGLLNDILRSAGVAERAYGVNGGNDFFVIFLTPEQFGTITSAPGYSPKDGPYIPALEPEWYGQPH
jgi:hypothetical protein